ncbi:hypothetical protein R6Z07F_011883 [Ovis aries]
MKRALLVEREIDIDRRLQDSEMVAAIPVKGRKLTDVKIGELPSMTRMWDFTLETLLEHLKAVTTGSTTGTTGRTYPEASCKGALSIPAKQDRARGGQRMDIGDNTQMTSLLSSSLLLSNKSVADKM